MSVQCTSESLFLFKLFVVISFYCCCCCCCFFVTCVGAAVDGGYSDWSEFSECSATCGEGLRIRKRSCNNPEPKNGGKNCNDLGADTDTKSCNSFPCRECVYF